MAIIYIFNKTNYKGNIKYVKNNKTIFNIIYNNDIYTKYLFIKNTRTDLY